MEIYVIKRYLNGKEHYNILKSDFEILHNHLLDEIMRGKVDRIEVREVDELNGLLTLKRTYLSKEE